MTDLTGMLRDLESLGVDLHLEGDRLRVSGKKSALTPEIQDRLISNRSALKAHLKSLCGGRDAASPGVPEPPGSAESPSRFSTFQRRLWALSHLGQPMSAFNIAFAVRIAGTVDLGRLRDAVADVVATQESLRLRFAGSLENPVPDHALPALRDYAFGFSDPPVLSLDAVDGWLSELSTVEFDLQSGPLLRLHLARVSPTDHLLGLVFHHSIFDGTSIDLFWSQVAASYNGSALPKTRPYHDYIGLQQHWIEESRERGMNFWRATVSDDPPVLNFPTDLARPAQQEFDGAEVKVRVDARVRRALHDRARALGCTEYVLLLVIYHLALSRYTGQQDHVIGVPVSGRLDNPGFDDTIGCFVNVLPMRFRLELGQSLRSAARDLGDRFYQALDFRSFPLEEIVAELKLPRDASRSPVFQTTLGFRETGGEPAALGAASVSWFPLEQRTSQSDLTCWIEAGETLDIVVNYATSLFQRSSMAWFAGYVGHLIETVAAAEPDAALEDLIAIPRRHLAALESWNDTAHTADEQTLVERVGQMSRQRAAAAAFRDGRDTLTFAELERRANQLAHTLSAVIGERSASGLIGISLSRDVRLPVALLATQKAGFGIVPLDPSFPAARLAYILEDAGVDALLTEQRFDQLFGEFPGMKLDLDKLWAGLGSQPETPPEVPPPAIYQVIYTSGSTGRPKGVEVGQAQTANLLESMSRRPGADVSDRVLALTTLSFDISVLELWLPCWVGAECFVAQSETSADPAALMALIDEYQPTLMQATPAAWRLLLDAGWRGAPGSKLLCGGEKLPEDLASRLLERCGELWNMYGPTETTVWSTCGRVSGHPVTLGTPIDNTQIHVLDEAGGELPIGAVGEICIGGAGVNPGYWKRPEQTAERFVDRPGMGRVYRTGDYGRWRGDGSLQFSQRIDNQVKVRGFRIELGEIEAAIRGEPGIAEAAVAVRELAPGDLRIVAFLVAAGDQPVATIALRKALRKQLPDYMVPQHFQQLEAMPLTPNGKLDRNALPLLLEIAAPERSHVPPDTDLEQRVASIWSEVIGVERVGREDNFFDLGGHSLIALRAVSMIQEATGASLRPQQLITDTLQDIARALEPVPAKAASD